MNKKLQIGALIMAIVLTIRMLAIPLLYVDYQLRKDYIVNNLCENRLRPQMHCDGKCYLAKKIAATEHRDVTEKGIAFARLLFELPYYEAIQAKIHFDFIPELHQAIVPPYLVGYFSEYTSSHFQPPQA